MSHYIATFHTHLAALKSHRSLKAAEHGARMAPVPRKISSSCGTCVFYEAPDPCYELLDEDVEAVYEQKEEENLLLKEYD